MTSLYAPALAHAFYPGTRGKGSHINGDIHFWNETVKWVYGKPKQCTYECYNDKNCVCERNIYATAIHELGHALGLDHDENDKSCIMYGSVQDGEEYSALESSTFLSIKTLSTDFQP